jgi:hypothetical protein
MNIASPSLDTLPLPLVPRRDTAPDKPSRSIVARLFDRVALAALPWIARALGYTFRVGTDAQLAADAHRVLSTVWKQKGVSPDPDAASYAERYDRATTWIVAYRGRRPVGVMGLIDMRVASVALDYGGQKAPPGLPLDVTREIGRLAILREHRGGARAVMLGLLCNMLVWSQENGVELLFSGSTPALFRVYRRYNATARLLTAPRDPVPNPARDRYFAPLRAYGGEGVLYTFEVAGATPFAVFSRTLAGLRPGEG